MTGPDLVAGTNGGRHRSVPDDHLGADELQARARRTRLRLRQVDSDRDRHAYNRIWTGIILDDWPREL